MRTRCQKRNILKPVEESLSSISSLSIGNDYNTFGIITKELVGTVKIEGKIDYKDLGDGALMEKYI
jgi:hypothetical protein